MATAGKASNLTCSHIQFYQTNKLVAVLYKGSDFKFGLVQCLWRGRNVYTTARLGGIYTAI